MGPCESGKFQELSETCELLTSFLGLSELPSRAECFRKLGRDGYTAELKAT